MPTVHFDLQRTAGTPETAWSQTTHVEVIDGAGALIEPRGPFVGDVIRLEAVGKAQGEILVVLSGSSD